MIGHSKMFKALAGGAWSPGILCHNKREARLLRKRVKRLRHGRLRTWFARLQYFEERKEVPS